MSVITAIETAFDFVLISWFSIF